MRRVIIWFGLMAALISTSGCAAPPAAIWESDIEAIRELNQAYPAAWVAGDNEAVMAVFAEDAILIPHHGDDPVAGHEAIIEHFWPPDLQAFDVTEFVMEPAEITGEGSLAYVRGRFSIAMSFTQGGETADYANAGNYMWIVRRQDDGGWKVARFIWNDPPPQ